MHRYEAAWAFRFARVQKQWRGKSFNHEIDRLELGKGISMDAEWIAAGYVKAT